MTGPDSAAPPPHTVQVIQAPSRLTGLGVIALMIGAVMVLGIAFLLYLQMKETPAHPAPQVTAGDDNFALRNRLASAEAQLAALRRGRPGDTAAMSARLDDLDRRQSTLTLAQAALEARVAKLETADTSTAMRRAAAEMAFVNLVRASDGTGAFAVELQIFRALMPNTREAAELAPISLKGAASRSELTARFSDVSAKALADENSAGANGWLGSLWSNLGNLIIVRRIGDTKGHDSESTLARAGNRLNAGDLGGAVAEMKSLKGGARVSVQPWMDDAQARLAIERDIAALANRMAQLAASP